MTPYIGNRTRDNEIKQISCLILVNPIFILARASKPICQIEMHDLSPQFYIWT